MRRHPERGVFERPAVDAILDEGVISPLGFVAEGVPWVMPTMCARAGAVVYVHGPPASRRLLSSGAIQEVCIAMTVLGALVLARSAFNDSINYRSVMLIGVPTDVADTAAKMAVSSLGGSCDPRTPGGLTAAHAQGAASHQSAAPRHRRGFVPGAPPADSSDGVGLPRGARLIPTPLVPQTPIPAPDLRPGTPVPGYALRFRRRRGDHQ